MSKEKGTIETVSGLTFDYHKPEVRLQDVAHGLAHVCRFGGQTIRFYSVAEHSVMVARIVQGIDPHLALPALWHDAHEAYMGDLPRPLKELVGDSYRDIAAIVDKGVRKFLGMRHGALKHPLIKAADNLSVAYEASILMPAQGWEFARGMRHDQAEAAVTWKRLGLHPHQARTLFLKTHEELTQ